MTVHTLDKDETFAWTNDNKKQTRQIEPAAFVRQSKYLFL